MKKKEVIEIKNDSNVFEDKGSLQENFSKFLQQRKEIRKSQTTIEAKAISYRDHTDRMEDLRHRFVKQAKSYLGIPYGRKYLSPDHPNYNSPLFLDCCGLVRKCVNDLKEDFGFMLGRWNQAYQFDILPKEEIRFEEMKPGDLIFYTATYYPEKKWKAQPHNLVHVEIFLGGEDTPERTIAARSRDGVVDIFDTYRFESENYYDIRYHFKSIDTWLRGNHKSFCEEHVWHDALLDYNPNKYSLFKLKDQYEQAEELEEN